MIEITKSNYKKSKKDEYAEADSKLQKAKWKE